ALGHTDRSGTMPGDLAQFHVRSKEWVTDMRQFLLSLLNATLLLAVVLAGLGIWLTYRVEHVAADLIGKVDLRVADAVEGDLRDAVTDFHELRGDLGRFNDQLAQLIEAPEITLSPATSTIGTP
ncbi:MAG: hypothetical protein ACR2Q4_07205, partial [Geminicoccaceae bacterium]